MTSVNGYDRCFVEPTLVEGVTSDDRIARQTPFGGFKESGFGRDLSLHALDKYTGLKTTWIKL